MLTVHTNYFYIGIIMVDSKNTIHTPLPSHDRFILTNDILFTNTFMLIAWFVSMDQPVLSF